MSNNYRSEAVDESTLAEAQKVAAELASLLSRLQAAINGHQAAEHLQAIRSDIQAALQRLEMLLPPENAPEARQARQTLKAADIKR